MNIANLKIFLKEYRWVILAFVFFIAWKFFLIGIMWDGRLIPPEPDDSYEYIAHIASVSECQTGLLCRYTGVSMTDHSGFTYLSYKIALGLIGKIFHLSPEATFHLGFYFGTIFLAITLIPFLRTLTRDKKLIAWTILFLAFYHGTGEAHGFFWVVPSFFATALFLLLFSYISAEGKTRYWQYIFIGFISVVFTFSHPISIYLGTLFALYIAILFFLSKKTKKETLLRFVFVAAIIFISSLAQEQYLSHLAQTSYYGPEYSLLQAKNTIDDIAHGNTTSEYNVTGKKDSNLLEQKLLTLHAVYFKYIIPHWIAIIPFLGVLFVIFFRKNFKLISLYISSFIFFVVATLLHEFGFRSAIILWPITFITYAFGSWYLFSMAKNIRNVFLKNAISTVIIISVIIFLATNALLSFAFNSSVNIRNNYYLDSEFSTYLSNRMRPEDTVSIPGILLRTSAGVHFFLEQKIAPTEKHPTFIVVIDKSTEPQEALNGFSSMIAQNFSLYIGAPRNRPLRTSDAQKNPEGYSLSKEYGIIKIYQRNQ